VQQTSDEYKKEEHEEEIKYQTGTKNVISEKTNHRASAAGLWLMSAVISHSRRFTTCGCLKNTQRHHCQKRLHH